MYIVHPAENRTGLQIEFATYLSVQEQNFFLLWEGICIEIVHMKFCDPRCGGNTRKPSTEK